jgi:hypothetical protein
MLQNNKLLGHLAFLVMFILAAIFYLERAIFADNALAIFMMICNKVFAISSNRFGSVLPQVLPILAIRLHMPLRIVLLVFSVSYILFFYVIYLVITYWFRKDSIALAVPLIFLVGIRYSFFWIYSEAHEAMVYSVLLCAFLFFSASWKPRTGNTVIKVLSATLIMALCFFSHPVALFTVLFILGFFMIDQKLWKSAWMFFLIILISILAMVKVWVIPVSENEGQWFREFLGSILKIKEIPSSESIRFLFKHSYSIYLFTSLTFLITVIFYLVNRQYLKMTYYIVSTVLFLLIIASTFRIWFLPFLTEKNLMPLNLFVLLPFLNDVVFRSRKWIVGRQLFIMAAFVFGLAGIVLAAGSYTKRLNYIHSILHQTQKLPGNKFIVPERILDRRRTNVFWAIGVESLLLSSLDNTDSARTTYVSANKVTLNPSISLQDPNTFLCVPFNPLMIDMQKMDKRYFSLGSGVYRELRAEDLYNDLDSNIWYRNTFDDLNYTNRGDSCKTDDDGNRYFLLTSDFSPGPTSDLTRISKGDITFVFASARIFPMEHITPNKLNVVISHERGQKVIDYYMLFVEQDYSLKPFEWQTINVGGALSDQRVNDQLKVYIWDPERKKMKMDDMVVRFSLVKL